MRRISKGLGFWGYSKRLLSIRFAGSFYPCHNQHSATQKTSLLTRKTATYSPQAYLRNPARNSFRLLPAAMSDRTTPLEELRRISGDGSVAELKKRTELRLCNMNLTSVPLGVCDLTGLVMLWLGGNQLSSLPREISQLTRLMQLSLESNQLSSLPPEISELIGLAQLDVGDNQLSSLPREISRLMGLARLRLTDNQLSSLPPEISQLTGITRLYVYNNKLSSLPPEISQLTRVVRLSASNNQLTSLPSQISKLIGITELGLSNNKLSALPPEISQLTRLTYMSIFQNPIEELPLQITTLTKLKYLYIECEGKIDVKRAPRGIVNLPCWNNTEIYSWMKMSIADALRKLQLYDIPVGNAAQGLNRDYKTIYQPVLHSPIYFHHQGQHQYGAYYGECNPSPYTPRYNNAAPHTPHPQQYQSPGAATFGNDPNSEPVTGDYADVMTIGSEHVQKVGEGGYGTAYRVQLKKGIVAVKVLKKKAKPGTAEYNELTKEAKMMLNLRHENIISLYAFGCRNQEIMYVMEYADGNSIWDMIEANGALPFDKYIRYSIQINAGLKYLHSQTPPVEHRDLKPENVLLCNGVAKICDFGTSSARETISRTTGFKGTFHYAAPEYFDAMKGYGPMSDMYTFGLVVWAMTAGKRPYDDMNYGQIMAQKLHGNLPLIPPATPPKLALLMNECWNYNPCHRPSAADLEVRLVDISKNPTSPPLVLKTKSVRNMNTSELVQYLQDKNANPKLIQACKENIIGGAEFVILTEEDLKELVPGFMSVHVRAALKLIIEAQLS